MKLALSVFFVFFIAIAASSQNQEGIYLTIQCAKKAPKQSVAISDKQVCLAPNPIINISEFELVSDLQVAGDKIWFDVTVSHKALQTLLRISQNLPESTFAFVIDKQVFSTFTANELAIGKTFRFQGTGKERGLFSGTQKKIKEAIERGTTPQ